MKKNKNGIITAIIVYLGLILGIFVLVGGSTSQRNPQDTNEELEYEKEFSKYKERILNKHGINIHIYDDERIPGTENRSFKWVNIDDKLIEFLEKMEEALLRYPENMIKNEIRSNSQSEIKKMDIYLVTDIHGEGMSYEGFTVRTEKNREIMFLDINVDKVEYTLAHEMFHIIEKKGIAETTLYFNKVFTGYRWEENNPPGFVYSEEKMKDNKEHLTGDLEDIYFVSSYAKTSRSEDMAEVFGMMMSYEEDNVPDSFYSPHVINKMKFISEFLEENYESATDEAHWNRWLNSVDK